MVTVSYAQQRAQMEAIARRLSQGLTDVEIMDELRISHGTFYRYKFKAIAAFGNVAEKKTEANLEFEAEILKDRLIRLFRAMEITSTDRNIEASARVNAAAVAAEIGINIFRLEAEGFKARYSRDIRRLVGQSQIPGIKHIRDIPTELSTTNQTVTSTESINTIQLNEDQSSDACAEGKVF